MPDINLSNRILTLAKDYNLPDSWLMGRPYLFSEAAVHLKSQHADVMRRTLSAIESVVSLPAFQHSALLGASLTEQISPGNPGILFGYDFHITPEGPKLIEINTNAGGAFFIALLESAHSKTPGALKSWESQLTAMFLAEWRSVRPTQPLNCIAIVDTDPADQYFYPEFLLFQSLLQAHGIQTLIVDPSELSLTQGKLCFGTTAIDLVYNRLTDFNLSQPAHTILQQAYLENRVVLTPHPHAHALYANKRNLTLLSNAQLLTDCGADKRTIDQLLQVIPAAHIVNRENVEALWNTRKQFFFKPLAGHAGKGVYRGYNMTRRVLNDIIANHYMAQALVPPSEMEVAGERRKVDLRAYTYAGQILGFAARLYLGQTTNFRTPGGGFTLVKEY